MNYNDQLRELLDSYKPRTENLIAEYANNECVSEKIKKLLDEGMEQEQAVAVAIKMCEEGAA